MLPMHTLYDSDSYTVTHMLANADADVLATASATKTPTQEEVEDTLEQYAELAQNPIVVH